MHRTPVASGLRPVPRGRLVGRFRVEGLAVERRLVRVELGLAQRVAVGLVRIGRLIGFGTPGVRRDPVPVGAHELLAVGIELVGRRHHEGAVVGDRRVLEPELHHARGRRLLEPNGLVELLLLRRPDHDPIDVVTKRMRGAHLPGLRSAPREQQCGGCAHQRDHQDGRIPHRREPLTPTVPIADVCSETSHR